MDANENSEAKIQLETRGSEDPDAKEQPPMREITQTDHLNRRLLDAFLLRLNNCSSADVLPNIEQLQVNSNNNAFEDGQDFTANGQRAESSGKL